ncbi:hypothetical protein L1987_01635 [Smallanthus sonchifolius]|uniref:Uncharacterized protein n=1 Tax=Smallanthus sonchifolius TaxID=185202 RepID=A0ACB9K5N6_9ASTR|nr:hypothetical protein L1987_01635 [Smallanthus sonchifolius]
MYKRLDFLFFFEAGVLGWMVLFAAAVTSRPDALVVVSCGVSSTTLLTAIVESVFSYQLRLAFMSLILARHVTWLFCGRMVRSWAIDTWFSASSIYDATGSCISLVPVLPLDMMFYVGGCGADGHCRCGCCFQLQCL